MHFLGERENTVPWFLNLLSASFKVCIDLPTAYTPRPSFDHLGRSGVDNVHMLMRALSQSIRGAERHRTLWQVTPRYGWIGEVINVQSWMKKRNKP